MSFGALHYAHVSPHHLNGYELRNVGLTASAHCWLNELIMNPNQTIELIAARENKSARSIRMTLSLAFIAPPIVVAAIEGRLPRGFGAKRLMDLPMTWSHQWTALGLKVPA
jgi:site-specific DNA recombinase